MTVTISAVPPDDDAPPTVPRTNEQADEPMTAFPLDALPGPIRQFAIEGAASLTAPPELIAVPALVVAAAAIGGSRIIELKQGWTEPASVFAAVISPTGTMKSPALQLATAPLQALSPRDVPTWTADVTVERLAQLLADNPRGLLLIRDELSAWVKSMNQYKQGKGADRQFYLSVWSGAPVKVDRVGGGTPTSISIARPCLSVVGCMPPEVLGEFDDRGGIDDGFLHDCYSPGRFNGLSGGPMRLFLSQCVMAMTTLLGSCSLSPYRRNLSVCR